MEGDIKAIRYKGTQIKEIAMVKKKNIVVLSGAGVSAESGIQTFRDADGLWMGYNIEDVATPQAYQRNPQLVLDFYNMRRSEVMQATPNTAHFALAALEEKANVYIVTQNIDDLHERAGSTQVVHLHGEIRKMFSPADPANYVDVNGEIHLGDVCPEGKQYRPHVVWFGEAVPMLETALKFVQKAEILLIVGTSLQVYPAASLLHYASQNCPVFVVDKKIPEVNSDRKIFKIEEPAGKGVPAFVKAIEDLLK